MMGGVITGHMRKKVSPSRARFARAALLVSRTGAVDGKSGEHRWQQTSGIVLCCTRHPPHRLTSHTTHTTPHASHL